MTTGAITSLSFPKTFQHADGGGISVGFSAVEKLNVTVICPTFFCQTNQDTFQVAIISQSDLPFLSLFSTEVHCSSKATVLREVTFLERSGS